MSQVDESVRNGNVIHSLTYSFAHGIANINNVPSLVLRVIKEDMWQHFVVQSTEEEVHYQYFEEFVEAPTPRGLETTMETLRNLCCKDDEVRSELTKVTKRPDGNPIGNNQHTEDEEGTLYNIQGSSKEKAPTGTSKDAGLRRLSKDRPDLHQKVVDGEMSVHAACTDAGFRKKPCPVTTAKKAVEKMTAKQLKEFGEWFKTNY
jgi:hypothetical protein